MSEVLELIRDGEGDDLRLLSPEAGVFTCALPPGCALAPGQVAGSLLSLGRPRDLVVPAGVHGIISSPLPDRVHEPVGFHEQLYALRSLEAGVETTDPESLEAQAGGPVLRAHQGGRFYHRPNPDAEAFVEVGALLEDGTAIGLIEIMKTFSHVPYRPSGGLPARARVVRFLAGDGEDVTEGTPLLEVEPA